MRRSKAVVLPMLLVPLLLLVVLPACRRVRGTLACTTSTSTASSVGCPATSAEPIRRLPEREQLVVLVNGYLLAPLFLIVPLMVSAVLAADAFAGEKERKTLEGAAAPADQRPRPVPRQAARSVRARGHRVVARVRLLRGGHEHGRVAGDAPRLRADALVGRDDPVGRAGGRGARARSHGARVRSGPDLAGGEPARRRGDPPADLPRASVRPPGCCWSSCRSRSRSARRSGCSPSGSCAAASRSSPATASRCACDACSRASAREEEELQRRRRRGSSQEDANAMVVPSPHRVTVLIAVNATGVPCGPSPDRREARGGPRCSPRPAARRRRSAGRRHSDSSP